jgi:hypothetical protein
MTKSFMQLTGALVSAGRQLNVNQISQLMMQYNVVTQKMELFEETINEASMRLFSIIGSIRINVNMIANEMFNVDEEEMDISEMRSKILDEIGIKIHEDVCPLH